MLLLIIFFIVYTFKGYILDFLSLVVNYLGLTGIFIVVFLLDIIFFQPISPSVFLVLVLLSEQFNWYIVLVVVSISSLCGSVIDFYLGKYYGERAFGVFLSKKRLITIENLFLKYSHYAILIGAFTPIPYALVCWFAGTSKMPFRKFIILAPIARTALFSMYCLLVNYGLLSFLV